MTAAKTVRRTGSGAVWREALDRPLVALVLVALLAFSLAYQWPLAAGLSSPGIVLSGLYDLEGRSSPAPYRWTNGDAHLWFLGIGRQSYHVTLTLGSARPAGLDLPTVTLLANGTQIGAFTAPRPQRDSTFDVPAEAIGPSGDLDLNLQSGTFAPPNDLRTLGVALYALRVESAPARPVVPAPLPLIWGALAAAFVLLGAGAWLHQRAAWALGAVLVAALSMGFVLLRAATVELLPWIVLGSAALFAVGWSRRPVRRVN